MRADKVGPGNDSTDHKSPTLSESAQAEWKLLQDAIEPTKQSISRCIRDACAKPDATAKSALGIAATGAALVLAARVPGATGKVLSVMSKTACTAGGALYAWQVGDVLRPSVDTWCHPENVSKNATAMGDKAGRLVYETGFAAVAGGVGMASVNRGNMEHVRNFLSLRKTQAALAAEDSIILAVTENRSIDEFIANKKYALSEVPKEVKLSGRVHPPHTTDSDSAGVGDIRFTFSALGRPVRLYTEVLAAPGQWVTADFFEGPVSSLYFAATRDTLVRNSEKLGAWLQTYRGKMVMPEFNKDWSCAQYKLAESQRPDPKRLNEMAAYLSVPKLPVRASYSGNCYFDPEPPSVKEVESGSIWWKRPAGERGRVLRGAWEPHVSVCGQWIPCKLEGGAIRADLLRFESERQSKQNSLLIRDAMRKGSFSFDSFSMTALKRAV